VLVAVLAVTQTVGYGVLYYAFSVLVTPIAAELGVPTAAVTGALTVSTLTAAASAVPLGRWLDRHGGHASMTLGSAVGVVAVVAWSQVDELWQLYAVFVVIGLASAASLYDAAFAVVIAVTAPDKRTGALLSITIIAGFASSVFLPLTGQLLAHLGWRHVLLVLAGLLAAVAVPAHAAAVPRRATAHAQPRTSAPLRDVLHERRLWVLASAFLAQALAVSSVGVLLVTYLIRTGHAPTTAATLAGLLGVLSVAGRLLTSAAARRVQMARIAGGVYVVQGLGLLALPWLGQSTAGAAACIVAFGIGFGVGTIARPAILADSYGTARYATIAASIGAPVTAIVAFAPLGAAALPPGVFVTTAGALCLTSATLLQVAQRLRPDGPP
jgi:predicted MFS family arabinose efflux permease